MGDYVGGFIGVIRGDTRNLDNSSYGDGFGNPQVFSRVRQ